MQGVKALKSCLCLWGVIIKILSHIFLKYIKIRIGLRIMGIIYSTIKPHCTNLKPRRNKRELLCIFRIGADRQILCGELCSCRVSYYKKMIRINRILLRMIPDKAEYLIDIL